MISKIGLVIAAAVASEPSWAWAADDGEAKALVLVGAEHFKHREYDAARESFSHAYSLDPLPGTLLNLALAELNADKPVDAASHFRAYLAIVTEPAEKRNAVQSKWLPRAESKLARVQLVVPAGAEVLIDGQPAKPDPSLGVLEVVAGEHDIDVRAAGRDETQHVTAPAGAMLTMRSLVDDPAPPPPEPPHASFESPEEPPTPGPSRARVATAATLGAVALGGLGVGIGFGLAASQKNSDVKGGEGCLASAPSSVNCQHVNYDVSQEHSYEWASIGGYVGAGVAAAAGVAAWFLWPGSPVRVSAEVDPHQMGLAVVGRW